MKLPSFKKLSPRERQFVEAYVGEARFRAPEAAARAGYAPSYGYVLRRKPEVAEAIREVLSTRSLSTEEILDELRDVALAPTTHFMRVLREDEDGRPVSVRQDYFAKLKALELLGKAQQMFVERKQVDVEVRGYLSLAKLLADRGEVIEGEVVEKRLVEGAE